MSKTIFLANFDKNFLRSGAKRSDEKNFVEICQKDGF